EAWEEEADSADVEETALEPDPSVVPDTPEETIPPPSAEKMDDNAVRSRMRAIRFDDGVLDDNSGDSGLGQLSDDEFDRVTEADTPLELGWRNQGASKRGYTWLFALFAFVLLLTLGGQALWFNRDALSQNPQLRPLMDRVCNLLDCGLPALVDIRSIHSEALEVRSHPELANALSVH